LDALEQIKARGIGLKYIHCRNTGATSWLKEEMCTHVRVGCAVLGYAGMDDHSNPLGVEESASWRARVSNVHEIGPGESCGYSRYFKADRQVTVATINVGYGDGLYRPLVMAGGPVLLNDARTRFLATCMDQSFVDATGIACKPGDEVTIYGKSKGGAALSFDEMERLSGQTQVYLMTAINSRVKRVYTV
jgi:alanine racemase